MKAFCTGVSFTALVLASGGAAVAQSQGNAAQLDEIVVTAQKRAENLQDVPASVVAFSGAELEARALRQASELETITPGLRIASSNGGAVVPFLRGIGNQSTTFGNESSVALYVDGVYFSRLPQGFFALNNVERVEVLKGPQGTLFGRNSSGGVVQLVTRDPSHTPMMKGSLGYGNFDTIEGDAYAATGLSDKLAADISVSGRRQKEGYGIYTPTGHRVNFLDFFTIRSKWLLEPSDDLRITLAPFYTYSKTNITGGGVEGYTNGYLSAPFGPRPYLGFYDQDSNFDSYSNNQAWGVSLKAEQILPFARLTSITAYLNHQIRSSSDGDYTPRSDFETLFGGTIKQFTQELQLASLSDSNLTWIVGLYFFNATSAYEKEFTHFYSPSGAVASVAAGIHPDSKQRARSYAGFAQATYEIVPRVNLTAGIRYTMDRTRGDGAVYLSSQPGAAGVPTSTAVSNPPANKISNNEVTYRGALDYKVTDDALIYASISRGYKAALFNLLTYNPNPNRPETTQSYEVGLKSELADRRIRLNIAGFYTEIGDPQVSLIQGATVLLSNAQSARVKGVEFEVQAALLHGLTARMSGTYLNSKYKSYRNAPSGPPAATCPPCGAVAPLISVDASGNYTPYSPKFTGSVGLEYKFDSSLGSWFINADYMHSSSFYFEPDNLLRQRRYGLLTGQVKLKPTDKVGVRIWGKNLLDKKYNMREGTTAGPAGYGAIPGAPRTYGMAVEFSF